MRNGQTAEPNGAAARAYAYEGCAVHRRPRSLAGLGEDSAARTYVGSIRCTRDLRDNLDPLREDPLALEFPVQSRP
jgi:hypothetical protein